MNDKPNIGDMILGGIFFPIIAVMFYKSYSYWLEGDTDIAFYTLIFALFLCFYLWGYTKGEVP